MNQSNFSMADRLLTDTEKQDLLKKLKSRFENHRQRHEAIEWEQVQQKLEAEGAEEKLWSLQQMEASGGEPDVVLEEKGRFHFYDCATESPKGRRSLCYDQQAWESRKKFKPKNSAMALAQAMGVELLNEAEYQRLQELQPVDTKTSSWLSTPAEVRKLGGAIFGDYRFGRVFIYHNGAESYYGARGFRAKLIL